MPGQPPKFHAFLTDDTGKRVLTDENGRWIEFSALWEDKFPDKNGNPTYSGRTGKGDQRIRIYVNEPRKTIVEPHANPDDVPF